MKNIFNLQKFILRILFQAAILLFLLSFQVQSPLYASNQNTKTPIFRLPEIPLILHSKNQQISYLVSHYWDYFDFSNTHQLNNPDFIEEAFVNYISLFPQIPLSIIEKSIYSVLSKSVAGSKNMFDYFLQLYANYLDDPNSPYRQEDQYLIVLRYIIEDDQGSEANKKQARLQLQKALKNRPTNPANDFEYTLSNGQQSRMYKITSDYLILFFNNPACHDCSRVKIFLENSPIIRSLTKNKAEPSLCILAIFPDEDIEAWKEVKYPPNMINGRSKEINNKQLYDLRAIPTLYLLDKNKRVILKDANVEEIEKYLEENMGSGKHRVRPPE